MTIESVVNSQPLWSILNARWQKLSGAPAPRASFHQSGQDDEPDPPPAAPPAPQWPRIFPGL